MRLRDPGGLGTAVDRLHTLRAISDFARWTGDEGVCVPEVEVVEEIEGGRFLGVYRGPGRPILQVPSAGHSITIHELCHAADEQHGWLSNVHKDLIPVGHIDPVGYPSRYSQEHESLARICEEGPTALDLQDLVEARCGLSLEHPAQRLVLREIYEGARVARDGAGEGRLSFSTRSVDALLGGAELVDVASDDERVWLLSRSATGAVDPELLGSTVAAPTLSVWAVDPHSFDVLGVHHITRGSEGIDGSSLHHALADTVDGAALLVESSLISGAPGPLRLWRLGDPGSSPRYLGQTPTLAGRVTGPLRTVVDADHLYTHVVDAPGLAVDLLPEGESQSELPGDVAAVEGTWLALDLDDLQPAQTPLLDALQTPLWRGVVTRISARAGGAQFTVSAAPSANERSLSENQALMVWTDDREVAERVDVRRALLRQGIAVLPGGRLLARWGDSGVWNGIDDVGGLVVGEPDNRFWFLGDRACEEGSPPFLVERAMEVDGAAVLLARDGGGELLVRVDLEG